jgi:hypothetical protein
MLSEFWAKKMLSIDKNYKCHINLWCIDIKKIILDIIFTNSLSVMQLLSKNKQITLIGLDSEGYSINLLMFEKYFPTSNDYSKFCEEYGLINGTVIQPLLVFVHLFGTPEMLEILLKSDLIKKINFGCGLIKSVRSRTLFNDTTYNKISGNLMDFVTKMHIKNKWNQKLAILEKVDMGDLILNSSLNQTSYTKNMFGGYGKSFFDIDHKKHLIELAYRKKILWGNIAKQICEKYPDIKIKFLIAFITNISLTQYSAKIVFDHFEWNDEDIEFLKKIFVDYESQIELLTWIY